jgi:hypothetical protein
LIDMQRSRVNISFMCAHSRRGTFGEVGSFVVASVART